MIVKFIQFLITFLTVRQVLQEVTGETDGTETDSSGRGTRQNSGDLSRDPERIGEAGRIDQNQPETRPALEQISPNSWVHNPPSVYKED